MRGYSAWRLFREGLRHHQGWPQAWGTPQPKKRYRTLIVGGGGHGLATAYYLAKNHGISDVAVLERGWLGGGNTGRNTTIIRSNYLFPESAAFYDHSLKLYEGLSRDLNYNIMLSQRGLLFLGHSKHDLESMSNWVMAQQLNGIDVELASPDECRRLLPLLNTDAMQRFPLYGGLLQRRAGVARHDAVAWGFARAAAARGVDIVQNCEVTGFVTEAGRVVGVETPQGEIRAEQVALAAAGSTSVLCALADLKMPLISYALQAFVSEPLKPVLDIVALSIATGTYLSQSDKGELVIGGGLDLYPSYAQRGNLPVVENIVAGMLELHPRLRRLRMLRQWAGCCDVVHDSSPIVDETVRPGLYVNCGWGTGGFKATPGSGWCYAHHLAHGTPHELMRAFGFKRFETGAMIDEAAAAGIAH